MADVDLDQSENWRLGCKDATSMQAKARQKDLLTDVRFLVGRNAAARSFSAHKTILACGSPVFEAMFFGNLAEKQDPIPIPDDDPEAFQNMIRFLYGEPVSFPDCIVACKTHSIGDKYLIPQLQKMSESYLSTAKMNDTSFWELLQEGNPLSPKIVHDKFFVHIQTNATRLLKSEEFLHASEEIIKTVLKLDALEITEFDLLSFVAKWASENYTPEEEKTKLQTLLPDIRFSLLTPEEFCRFHGSFPDVLDAATSLEILKHLIVNYRLPNWCSTNTKRRGSSLLPTDTSLNSSVLSSSNSGYWMCKFCTFVNETRDTCCCVCYLPH